MWCGPGLVYQMITFFQSQDGVNLLVAIGVIIVIMTTIWHFGAIGRALVVTFSALFIVTSAILLTHLAIEYQNMIYNVPHEIMKCARGSIKTSG